MGTITGALIKGAGVAIGGSASIVGGAIAAPIGYVVKEAFNPRRTVTEADEQRAIRQAEATRQWRKEQKDKANKNPNLDYPASRQIVEANPSSDAGFTGGQESGTLYDVTMTADYYSIYTPDQVFSQDKTVAINLPGGIGDIAVKSYGNDRATVGIKYNNNQNYTQRTTDNVSTTTRIVPGSAKFSLARSDGQPDNSGDPPPFYGGQDPGVSYNMLQQTLVSESGNSHDPLTEATISTNYTTYIAPISGYQLFNPQGQPITFAQYKQNGKGYTDSYYLEVYHDDGNQIKTHSFYATWGFEPLGFVREDGQPDTGGNPPIPDNNVYSETQPTLPVQPTPSDNLTEITAPTPKELAKQLYGLIKSNKIDDAQTTPEVRDELRKLIAADNAITDKTNAVDTLDNSDGYASAYSDGYQDGFTASLEKDRLNAQNKANNLDVAIPKPSSTQAKQKPTAVTTTANTATQKKAKETTTTTKLYVAGKTPVKETTIEDNSTGVKTITKAHAETGKVISVKRTIPAGVTVTSTGVGNTPITNTPTTSYKFVGAPSNTGTGVTTIPQVPTVKQAPTIPQIAGGAITTAAIAAAVYSESGIETLTSAAAAGTCQTTQPGGCMQKNVVDPINASTGTLFNNFANTALAAQNAAIQAIVQNTNDIVKHGTYGLQAIQEAAGKAWEATHMDKVISLMNLWVSTHNAAMLSRNLAQTIAELGTQTFNLFGIKDSSGNAIDVSNFVNKTFQSIIETIVPEAIRTDISATWKKLSTIHNAAVATASAIVQTKNAVLEVQEVTSDWIANIGNSLQQQGILEEDSYPWMQDNNNFTDPYSGFLNKVNNVQEVVEAASNFVSTVQEIVDSTQEAIKSSEELIQSFQSFIDDKTEEEANLELASQSPVIDRLDLINLESDEI